MVRLSEHFTLAELTVSEWASRNNVDNQPTLDIIESLKKLALRLEEVRTVLGKPIHINSGYRSPKVNKAIGGKPTSSHQYGLAADLISPEFGTPEQICQEIMESGIKFDQLILEYPTPEGGGWVHLGIGKQMRQQVLTINRHGAFAGLHM
jgi:zinc D-Ala-D-Ala carboxypeptidase